MKGTLGHTHCFYHVPSAYCRILVSLRLPLFAIPPYNDRIIVFIPWPTKSLYSETCEIRHLWKKNVSKFQAAIWTENSSLRPDEKLFQRMSSFCRVTIHRFHCIQSIPPWCNGSGPMVEDLQWPGAENKQCLHRESQLNVNKLDYRDLAQLINKMANTYTLN